MNKGPTLKQLLADISESVRFTTVQNVAGIAATCLFGSILPDKMTRNFWYLTATSVDGSQQKFYIYKGNADMSSATNILTKELTNSQTGGNALILGGDPESPFLKSGPISTVGTNDYFAAVHETSAIDFECMYYDSPIDIPL